MKHILIAASFFLFASTFVSCKKDRQSLSAEPLLGTWQLVADRGISGYHTYTSGEGFLLRFKRDYTYLKSTPGIADETGSFKLSRLEIKDAPTLQLIDYGTPYGSSYTFVKDTLVLIPYTTDISVDYAIWETKFVRISNE
jgi:hypothetical protein